MKIEKVWQDLTTEKVIGRGAYGTVYKCFREENGEKVYSAVKVITIPQNDEEYFSYNTEGMTIEQTKEYYRDIVDDFTSEIKILESLKGNKNVVEIRNYHVEENLEGIGWNIFIEMELLTDFNSYSSDKTFTEEEVLKLGTDLCNALIVCNEKNIIHRDIKPENIFVSDTGDFKLGDFGVSRQMEKTYASMSRKGTFNYMAPEVFYSKKYDSRADVYSLGLVMYKLLNNNRMPFLDPEKQIIKYSERQQAFEKRINGEPIPHLKGVDSELNAVIMRACEYKAENRYSNAKDMKKALEKKKLSGASGLFYRYKKLFVAIAAVLGVAVLTAAIAGVVKNLPAKEDVVTTTAKTDVTATEEKKEYSSYMVSGKEFTARPIDNLFVFANNNGVYLFNEKTEKTTQVYDKASVSPAFNGKEICFVSDGNTSIYKTNTEAEKPEKIFSSKDAEITSVLYCDKNQVIAICGNALVDVDVKKGTSEKIADLGDSTHAVYANGYIVYLNNAKQGEAGCEIYSYNIADKTSVKLADDAFAAENFAEKTYGISAENSTQVNYLSKKNGVSQVKIVTCSLDGKGKQTTSKALDNFNDVVFWDSNRVFYTGGKDGISFYDLKSKTVIFTKITADEIYSYDGKYYAFEKFENAYRLNEILADGTVKAAKYTDKLTKEFEAVSLAKDSFLMWDKTAMNISSVKTTDIDPLLVEPTEKEWEEFENEGLYNTIRYLNFENYNHENVNSKSFLFDYLLQFNGESIIYGDFFDEYKIIDYYDEPDPNERFHVRGDIIRTFGGAYSKFSAEKVEWLAENIFNIKYDFINDLTAKKGEYLYSYGGYEPYCYAEPYYYNGYYYFECDIEYEYNSVYRLKSHVKTKEYNADGTIIVTVDLIGDDGEIKCSFTMIVGLKEIKQKRYWSVYHLDENVSMSDFDKVLLLEKQTDIVQPNYLRDSRSLIFDKSKKNILGVKISLYGTFNCIPYDYSTYSYMTAIVKEKDFENDIIAGTVYDCCLMDLGLQDFYDSIDDETIYIDESGIHGVGMYYYDYDRYNDSNCKIEFGESETTISLYFEKSYPVKDYINGDRELDIEIYVPQGSFENSQNSSIRNYENTFFVFFSEEEDCEFYS